MERFWEKGWISRARQEFRKLRQLQISVHAAHTSYFLILSAFPTLVLLLGLLRHTRLRAADLMDLVQEYLPGALQGYAWSILSSAFRNSSASVLSVSALTALWSASRGIYGLMKGLNRIGGVEEHRGWLRTRLLCAVYMVLFLLALVLTLVLHVFGSTLAAYLQYQGVPGLADLRFFLLVGFQSLLFCVLFMYLPGKNRGFRESLPGALAASLGWMGASSLFGIYVERFSHYASIFGSVYTVALGMLWLYVCVSIVFYGAVLNRYLANAREK